jgi:DNA-binding NtrC family response regulator
LTRNLKDLHFRLNLSWLKRESAESRQPREGLSTLADREVEIIEAALADCHGRISGPSGAAAKLGIPWQTLEPQIHRLGISKYGLKRQSSQSGYYALLERRMPSNCLASLEPNRFEK